MTSFKVAKLPTATAMSTKANAKITIATATEPTTTQIAKLATRGDGTTMIKMEEQLSIIQTETGTKGG